jgi:outer membrane protein OmpA-like peptidoglycan-associated protein
MQVLRLPLLAFLLGLYCCQHASAQAPPATTGKNKFDPPRILAVLRPNDTGELRPGDGDQRLYYIDKGQEVSINRGDILNVYREKKVHPALARGMRIFIGTITIIESQNGSSMGTFAKGESIDLHIIKFKVPLKGDLVVPRLSVDSGVLFNPGDFSLAANAGAEFTKVAKFIEDFSPSKIIIEGHTDSDGDAADNQTLSNKRANLVVKFLINTYPFITDGMIEARGYGENQPIVPNDTPENKKLNRRIEVIIWE